MIIRSKSGNIWIKKPTRNNLCPCGSGKKYKKCHWPATAKEILQGNEDRSIAKNIIDQVNNI